MPHPRQSTRHGRDRADLRRAIEEAADVGLMEAVVSGCALVAYADGWVRPEEHRRMTGLIRSFEPLRAFGLDEVLAYFEETTEAFRTGAEISEQKAFEKVARLKGRGHYPHLLVMLCGAIAEADGGFDDQERATMMRICAALDLDPAEYDLVAA